MARHRDVRNRNFSYDEMDADFFDEDEEDAACEEHRQHMLSLRGGNGGGMSLSSHFTVLENVQEQQQQTSEINDYPTDRRGDSPTGGGADADLVAAIAVELESRLGKGFFSGEQIRQAVVASGYEIDTAQAILLSSSEAQVQVPERTASPSPATAVEAHGERQPGAGAAVGPPSGLPPDPSEQDGSPSALAFGLCVDGRDDWRRRAAAAASGTNGALAPPPPDGAGRGGAAARRAAAPGGASFPTPAMASAAAARDGIERFGFDTPSPDDVNLSKQAAARGGGIGGGGIASGIAIGSGSGGGRKAGGAAATFSSPKANVVHISGSTPEISATTRKSVDGAAAATAAAAAVVVTPVRDTQAAGRRQTPTSTSTKGRDRSPASTVTPSPQQAAAAAAADESDGDQAGEKKERLAMVVIGHVDAGKSTLMGQVSTGYRTVNRARRGR